jgi:deazaflavin-dependent oxidoreductase (nitroreductase family)
VDGLVAGEPFCYLTTTGRATGRPHRIEIWFAVAPDRDTIYLLAGGRERSDWVANLRRAAQCAVEIAGRQFDGRGRVVEGTGEDRVARDLVYEKYRNDDDLVGWRERALPVAIDLTPGAAS